MNLDYGALAQFLSYKFCSIEKYYVVCFAWIIESSKSILTSFSFQLLVFPTCS